MSVEKKGRDNGWRERTPAGQMVTQAGLLGTLAC